MADGISGISDVAPVAGFIGSGTRGPFPLVSDGAAILYASADEIHVFKVDGVGEITAWVDGVDYVLTSTLDSTTGLYTGSFVIPDDKPVLAGAGANAAERLVAYREGALDQSFTLAFNTAFPSQSFTALQNRVALRLQEMRAMINRAPLHPHGDDQIVVEDRLKRRGKVFGYDPETGAPGPVLLAEVGDGSAVMLGDFSFSGDGVETDFLVVNQQIPGEAAVLIWVGGSVQATDNYTVTLSGDDTRISFGSPPPSGTDNIIGRILGYRSALAGEAEDNAAASAIAAAASASSASNSAADALTRKEAAGTSAINAAASSTTASGHATTATTQATAAAASAVTAAAAATAAQQAAAGSVWTFDTGTTDADPGAGKVRLNNASPASATQIYISETDAYGAAMAALLALLDNSTNTTRALLLLRNTATPQNFALFTLTGDLVDGGSYDKLPVTYVASNGTLTGAVALSAMLVGDKGATGSGVGDLLAANNLNDVADKPTARSNLSLYSIAQSDALITTHVALPDPHTQYLLKSAVSGNGLTLIGQTFANMRTSLSLGTAALVADSTLIHNTGTETVGGDKTFTGTTTHSANIQSSTYIDVKLVSGNANARISGRYNVQGTFHDALVLSDNYKWDTGAIDSASLGTAMMLVKAQSGGGGGVIEFFTGAQNTAPTRRAYIDTSAIVGEVNLTISKNDPTLYLIDTTGGGGSGLFYTNESDVHKWGRTGTAYDMTLTNGTLGIGAIAASGNITVTKATPIIGLVDTATSVASYFFATSSALYLEHSGSNKLYVTSAAVEVLNADTRIVAAPASQATNSAGFRGLGLPRVPTTATTFQASDNGQVVRQNSASSRVQTIPTFASVPFVNGALIPVRNIGAGTMVLTPDTGVTLLNEAGVSGSITLNQHHGGTLERDADTGTNTWRYTGPHA